MSGHAKTYRARSAPRAWSAAYRQLSRTAAARPCQAMGESRADAPFGWPVEVLRRRRRVLTYEIECRNRIGLVRRVRVYVVRGIEARLHESNLKT